MQTTVDFIDAIKTRHSLASDYAAAKLLGIAPQAIYSYRAKREFFGEERAVKAAELLGLPPGYVLACVAAERAKIADVRSAWERAARALQNTAAAVILGLFVTSGFAPALAHGASAVQHCILCQIRRWRWIVVVLGLFSASHAEAAERWTSQDFALEATYQALAAADWAQTRWISRHPLTVSAPYPAGGRWQQTVTRTHETNPILGVHPSIGRVNLYFVGMMASHALITALLPARWRPYWQGAGIMVEAGYVAHNAAIGIHAQW